MSASSEETPWVALGVSLPEDESASVEALPWMTPGVLLPEDE